MKWIKRLLFIFLVSTATDIYIPNTINAQCPMCRMTAEGNLKEGGSAGRGLNTGILYMLSMPYIIVVTLGFVWYRNQKKSNLNEVDPRLN